MKYLATFYTHYGATRFHKHCAKEGIPAKMTPTPRELSASCGVCVLFEAAHAPDTELHEDMEKIWIYEN
jgi:ribosomal protein L7Ae-like RNA K-turn-binding protein